jgi:cardiolipin synthase A/B
MLSIALIIFGAAVVFWLILVMLFAPPVDYHLRRRVSALSRDFARMLRASSLSAWHEGNRVEVFTNGPGFYPAMIAAIREARRTVNLECYIFNPGRVADDFITALCERSRAGVEVSIVADAIGSLWLWGVSLRRLREAGCRVHTYQALRWWALARLNNRTHRELLVIDGRIAFMGGAGISDFWAYPEKGRGHWRDTMVRVEGPAVSSIQGVFAENWTECCGEILAGEEFFPPLTPRGETHAVLIKSSPSDRATGSRIAFQALIDGAGQSLQISTPYFLPDGPLRRALVAAARRGVNVRVIVPGPPTDQRWVRYASRRLYGPLLRSGIRIFEYQPAMMHAKILIVDGVWATVGTTNMDPRSFEHNDEVNLLVCDRVIAERLGADFEDDLTRCHEITLDAWRQRPIWEKALNPWVSILERQL